jgi:metal-sulfur cluster biosynthetic enzyme
VTEPDRNQIEQAIAQFVDPDLDQNYIDAGCIQAIDLYGDNVGV